MEASSFICSSGLSSLNPTVTIKILLQESVTPFVDQECDSISPAVASPELPPIMEVDKTNPGVPHVSGSVGTVNSKVQSLLVEEGYI